MDAEVQSVVTVLKIEAFSHQEGLAVASDPSRAVELRRTAKVPCSKAQEWRTRPASLGFEFENKGGPKRGDAERYSKPPDGTGSGW